MQNFSPIVIFAFNRPDALMATINAVLQNTEAKDSDLFIFVDGPRVNKDGEKKKVKEVQDYVKTISGFKSVKYTFAKNNKGLGPSIIDGVNEVINQYGSIIVIEDDLIVQPNFLSFMNEMLKKYRTESLIWSVCGYSNRIKFPKDYPYDIYFGPRSSSWGWATWSDRWNSVDWSFDKWEEWKTLKQKFNRWGGSDCFSMLNACRIGKNKSWAIRFCFNQFIQDKLSLFPIKSLVRNDGFDGKGTNCRRYSRFKYELMNGDVHYFNMPSSIEVVPYIRKQIMRYNSIPLRIWSRLMYMIYR